MSSDNRIGRRNVLRSAAGILAGGALATPAAARESDYGGWFTADAKGGETTSYDGTVDRTGQDEVTIEVGTEGNGGPYAFAPTAVRISPGTTVTFEWVSDTHNVLVEEQPSGAGWAGHEAIENTGFSFEHTFETEGVYKYYCEPHLTLGMKGAVVVGDAQTGGGGGGDGARPDWGGWLSGIGGGFRDARGQDEVTVEVGAEGNGGPYAFAPAGLWISPGTTVTFEWVSDTHNVLVEEQPPGAGWEGHETIENTGFSFEHTFETGGIYDYYCEPHRSLGMKGAIAVGDDVPTAAAGGGGGQAGPPAAVGSDAGRPFSLPGGEFGSVIMTVLFGAAAVAVLPILVSEGYAAVRAAGEAESGATEEPAPDVVREIGHDEFDPTGTASLIAIYFVILLVMWVFVYFVEFLGNGPTVIG